MPKPGFYICLGPDSVLLKEHIEALLAAHAPEKAASSGLLPAPGPASGPVGGWEKQVFWGDEFSLPAFQEALGLQGLFNTPRALILRRAQSLPASELREVSTLLGRAGGESWPLLCFELDYERGKPKIPKHIDELQCLAFARKQGWYKEIPPLNARGIKEYAAREARRLGLALNQAELESLAGRLPPDAGAIRLEMDKIRLAVGAGGGLRPEVLATLSYQPDLDIFAFLRSLQDGGRPDAVWGKFMRESLEASDAGLFSFLAMLLREARTLWRILAGENVFLPPSVLQSKIGLARRMGYGGLARIWDLALAADKGVKSGEHSPQQAFERLLAELFKLFGR